MLPASLQDGHFLGLQRVSTFSPHFSQVKTAMDKPPDGMSQRYQNPAGKTRRPFPPITLQVAT
jgi:hypothetical protein